MSRAMCSMFTTCPTVCTDSTTGVTWNHFSHTWTVNVALVCSLSAMLASVWILTVILCLMLILVRAFTVMG